MSIMPWSFELTPDWKARDLSTTIGTVVSLSARMCGEGDDICSLAFQHWELWGFDADTKSFSHRTTGHCLKKPKSPTKHTVPCRALKGMKWLGGKMLIIVILQILVQFSNKQILVPIFLTFWLLRFFDNSDSEKDRYVWHLLLSISVGPSETSHIDNEIIN